MLQRSPATPAASGRSLAGAPSPAPADGSLDAGSLDAERCYRAVRSKDARFDGYFVTAVRTTGIYCRPSCPAVPPKRGNVEFFATAAAAHDRGYRACKRCRPDASPGSPQWDVRGDAVGRAMRLIADGVVDREGVAGLARRLSYSERHLNRLVTAELGAGPLAIARAQRAQAARVLIETTAMSFTDIAYAAGFGSIRQFNDTIGAVFAATPTALRHRAALAGRGAPDEEPRPQRVRVELAARQPFDLDATLTFLAARAIPGVEQVVGGAYRRALSLPHGHGVALVHPGVRDAGGRSAVVVELDLDDWRDLAPAVRRIRRLLDLDADPVAINSVLAASPAIEPCVTACPGRRVPGSVDPFETAMRAVVGQQISVAGARTIAGRLVAAAGTPLSPRLAEPGLTHLAPDPGALAALDPASLPMPRRRAVTLVELADRVATGALVLDAGADRGEARDALLDVPGVGPWTADYVLMRGLGDPDVFLPTDLGVRRALDAAGLDPAAAAAWRPWRSYALHHLWSAAPPLTATQKGSP